MVLRLLRFWALLLAAAAGAYVLSFNRDLVLISIPGLGDYEVTQGIALIASFVGGATVMLVYQLQEIIMKALESRKLRKKIQSLEQEVSQLRAPIGFSE